ncbi:MAG: glycosyltransferase [Anaerolineae bacterium]
MVNVCVLLDAFDHISGISTTYKSQLHLAQQAGINLTVIAPTAHGQPARREAIDGSTLARVGARFSLHLPVDKSIRLDLPDRAQFERTIADSQPDILQVVTPGPVGMIGARLAKSLGVPLVGYFHTDYLSMQTPQVLQVMYPNPVLRYGASTVMQTYNRISERITYAKCEVVCCEAEKIADGIRARQLNPNPLVVPATLRHDLDPTQADPDAFMRRFQLPADRPRVLYVGRFGLDKNIQLVAELARRCPEFHFVAVGGGPLQHVIEGIPNVTITGWLQGADLWSAYAASTVFLMPSWNETFGLVSLEAMAMGLPVITANTAGSAPDVLAADAGAAFALDDHDGLINLLRGLIADSARMAQMKANALAWYARNHPAERYRRFAEMAYQPLVRRESSSLAQNSVTDMMNP